MTGIWRSKGNPNVTATVISYKADGEVKYQLPMLSGTYAVSADIWNKLWEKT